MELVWEIWGLPKPEAEYHFCPGRKFRFDWAWPERKVAVEQEGGIFRRTSWGTAAGAHSRPANILRDIEKGNLACKLGWRVFRFTPREIKAGIAQGFMKEILA